MLKGKFLLRASVFAVAIVIGLLLISVMSLYAAPKSPLKMKMHVYTTVVDEQDLNTYYNTTGSCPGSSASIDICDLRGDLGSGPTTAYGFVPPWTLSSNLVSASYIYGQDCNPNNTSICTKVEMGTNLRTVNADIRGTAGPRTVTLDFSQPCTTCSMPGNATYFGNTTVTTVMHVTFFLDIPYTDMAVCSSKACPEALAAWARLWFPDPMGDPLLEYRVDWGFLRILRMNATTWYVLADGCDGTQLAHLYRLHNQQKKPSIRFQGSYLIPFFVVIERQ